jgi:mono/diheme cytochrome c family protein
MRHQDVRTVSWVVVAGLAAACALFATGQRKPAEAGVPATAEQLYGRHCADCHELEELLEPLRGAKDREATRAELVRRLAHHGKSTGAEDLALADWLVPRSAP